MPPQIAEKIIFLLENPDLMKRMGWREGESRKKF